MKRIFTFFLLLLMNVVTVAQAKDGVPPPPPPTIPPGLSIELDSILLIAASLLIGTFFLRKTLIIKR